MAGIGGLSSSVTSSVTPVKREIIIIIIIIVIIVIIIIFSKNWHLKGTGRGDHSAGAWGYVTNQHNYQSWTFYTAILLVASNHTYKADCYDHSISVSFCICHYISWVGTPPWSNPTSKQRYHHHALPPWGPLIFFMHMDPLCIKSNIAPSLLASYKI